MKFLLIFIFSFNLFAECNIKTDIVRKDNFVAYSYDCHQMVGKLIQDEKDRKDQIVALNESLKFKDLEIKFSEKQSELWQNEAENQYKIIQNYSKYNKYQNWMYFGGGIGLTILSVRAAGQIGTR